MNHTNITVDLIPSMIVIALIVEKFYLNKKAGEPGWYAIIPFYSEYLLFKYASRQKDYIKYLISIIIASLIPLMGFIYLSNLLIITISLMDGNLDPIMENTGISTLNRFVLWDKSKYIMSVLIIIGIISLIYAFVLNYKKCKGLAINFGCEEGYKWGLFFLPMIFLGILAFDSTYQYQLNKDIVYNDEYPTDE